MSTYKDELNSLFKDELNSLFGEARMLSETYLQGCAIVPKLNECYQRTLEIVTQLEHSLDISRKATNAQYAIIARAQDEARELRTRLESRNKALGLVVQALAETIGEEER